jgi:hypothetical protein
VFHFCLFLKMRASKLPSLTRKTPGDTAVESTVKSVVASGAAASRISNYVTHDEGLDIDAVLSEHKYTIVTKYAMGENAEYIKAISPLGDIVYILIDQKGTLALNDGEIVSVKNIEGSKIMHSEREKAATCTSLATCGTMMECADELCTIVRTDDAQTTQKFFSVSESYAEKKITPEGSAVSFPLVKLSEIRLNGKLTATRIANATHRIYDSSYSVSSKGIEDVISESKKLTEACQNFTSTRESCVNAYARDILYLQERAKEHFMDHLNGGPRADPQKYTDIRVNLYARKKAINDAAHIAEAFSGISTKLVALRLEMEELTTLIADEFKHFAGPTGKSTRILTSEEAFAI